MTESYAKHLSKSDVLRLFDAISVWRRRGERAPHKPLLVIYAVSRILRGGNRLIPFAELDNPLRQLLKEFGPTRASYHPEYPFWRLQNDHVWVVETSGPLVPRKGHSDPKKSELDRNDARGGFILEIDAMLRQDSTLAQNLARGLLDRHFPTSVHDQVLRAVSFPNVLPRLTLPLTQLAFADVVLRAYQYKCAVCGYEVAPGTLGRGLEPAHIRWPQAGGPDDVCNGLSLCVLHRNAFDRGALGISTEGTILVYGKAHTSRGLDAKLVAYEGQALGTPEELNDRPHTDFVRWHQIQVFKGPIPGKNKSL